MIVPPMVGEGGTVVVGRGRKISGAERDKLAADLGKAYASGVSIRALAEGCGRSYGFVHRLLTDAGITLRARGGYAHR